MNKAKDDISAHLDVTAVTKTTLADTVCQAHVVARLVSCVCLRWKSLFRGMAMPVLKEKVFQGSDQEIKI